MVTEHDETLFMTDRDSNEAHSKAASSGETLLPMTMWARSAGQMWALRESQRSGVIYYARLCRVPSF